MVVLALAEGEPLDAEELDELSLSGCYRAAAGELGDQGYLIPAGLRPQPGGNRRSRIPGRCRLAPVRRACQEAAS